jgi:hypothetical protein
VKEFGVGFRGRWIIELSEIIVKGTRRWTGQEQIRIGRVKVRQDVTGVAESVMVKMNGVDTKAFIEEGTVFIEVIERGEREVISGDVIFSKHGLDNWYCGTRG